MFTTFRCLLQVAILSFHTPKKTLLGKMPPQKKTRKINSEVASVRSQACEGKIKK